MDKLIGLVLAGLSIGLVGIMLAHAVHHDCSYDPPLPSTIFGKAVPIEAICTIVR